MSTLETGWAAPPGDWDVQELDQDQVKALMGAVVLVGVTEMDKDDSPIEQRQFYGEVVSIDASQGIKLRLQGSYEGQEYTLPPDLRSFSIADEGTYTLRSSNEVVVDPDYLTTWILKKGVKN